MASFRWACLPGFLMAVLPCPKLRLRARLSTLGTLRADTLPVVAVLASGGTAKSSGAGATESWNGTREGGETLWRKRSGSDRYAFALIVEDEREDMLGGRVWGRTGRGGVESAGVALGAVGEGFLVGDGCGECTGLVGETGTVEGGTGQGDVRIKCAGEAACAVLIPGGSVTRSVDHRASAVIACGGGEMTGETTRPAPSLGDVDGTFFSEPSLNDASEPDSDSEGDGDTGRSGQMIGAGLGFVFVFGVRSESSHPETRLSGIGEADKDVGERMVKRVE